MSIISATTDAVLFNFTSHQRNKHHKMVKHTHTIRQKPTNCLSVLDILWGWRLTD